VTDGNPDLRRFDRWANILVWGIVLALFAIPASIGVAVARAFPSREYPAMEWFIRNGVALLILAQGLRTLFRLAVYGPANPSQNRMQLAVINTALILIGVSQLAADRSVALPLAGIGLVLFLAALLRRPRKLF
jgi:hypothetical protein